MLQTLLYGRGLSKNNAQEREGGNTLHGSGVDEAGTGFRGLSRGTGRRAGAGTSSPWALSGRERCSIDRGGGGGCGTFALLAGEVDTLQIWIRPSSLNIY